jgi:hypothetical protein
MNEEKRAYHLAGFLSTIDVFSDQHPEDLLPIAKNILGVLRTFDAQDGECVSKSILENTDKSPVEFEKVFHDNFKDIIA